MTEADRRDQWITKAVQRIRDESVDGIVQGTLSNREAAEMWRTAEVEAEVRWMRRQRAIPLAVRRALLSRPCAYCGDTADCIDHVLPVSRGGTRDPENLAPACTRCNGSKLDYTVEEWKKYLQLVGRPWPPQSRAALIAEIVEDMLDVLEPNLGDDAA
jgi:5-methylcytosine-specific restriction endonuclease McrA